MNNNYSFSGILASANNFFGAQATGNTDGSNNTNGNNDGAQATGNDGNTDGSNNTNGNTNGNGNTSAQATGNTNGSTDGNTSGGNNNDGAQATGNGSTSGGNNTDGNVTTTNVRYTAKKSLDPLNDKKIVRHVGSASKEQKENQVKTFKMFETLAGVLRLCWAILNNFKDPDHVSLIECFKNTSVYAQLVGAKNRDTFTSILDHYLKDNICPALRDTEERTAKDGKTKYTVDVFGNWVLKVERDPDGNVIYDQEFDTKRQKWNNKPRFIKVNDEYQWEFKKIEKWSLKALFDLINENVERLNDAEQLAKSNTVAQINDNDGSTSGGDDSNTNDNTSAQATGNDVAPEVITNDNTDNGSTDNNDGAPEVETVTPPTLAQRIANVFGK